MHRPLDWEKRVKIAIGSARGLAYLHEDSQPCVIHRDFKASNILLEYNFTAKVADFGLAKQAPEGQGNYVSTRVMGTFGYALRTFGSRLSCLDFKYRSGVLFVLRMFTVEVSFRGDAEMNTRKGY